MNEMQLNELLKGNDKVEEKIVETLAEDNYLPLLAILQKQIGKKKCFLAPVDEKDSDDGGKILKLRSWKLPEDENVYLAAFTSLDELQKGPKTECVPYDIRLLLDIAYEADEYSGLAINPWGKGIILEEKQINLLRKNSLLHDAIRFATEKHEGQCRKGTMIPYIVHPMETMQILHSMDAGVELMMAGVLHDTLEDTETTYDELELLFGKKVADWVQVHTEDKQKTWEERKEKEIQDTIDGDINLKALVLADKLANLRAIARDYARIGDELWTRFSKGKENQAWYYSAIQDALWDTQLYPEIQGAYWEFVGLYKDVFVTYYMDEAKGMLYQQDTNGEIFALKKGIPQWNSISKISKNVIQVERKHAERVEDNWNEPFWKLHERDLEDARYNLFTSNRRSTEITIQERKLVLSVEDFGEVCESINGKDEYEFWYALDEDNTRRFLVQLRFKYGVRYKLETILKKAFGKDNAPEEFRKFCEEVMVEYHFSSY